jgi:hypothetical protein
MFSFSLYAETARGLNYGWKTKMNPGSDERIGMPCFRILILKDLFTAAGEKSLENTTTKTFPVGVSYT